MNNGRADRAVPFPEKRSWQPVGPAPMRLRISTPWQYDLVVESDGESIVHAAFDRRRNAARRPADSLLREAAAQVRAYFLRRLKRFDLPLALSGTPFTCEVWRCVAALSFG